MSPEMLHGKDGDGEGLDIKLERICGPEIRTLYADSYTATHSAEEFKIAFYEVDRPILTGTPEENREELARMGSIKANCVARILLTPSGMRTLIEVLQTNYEKWGEQGFFGDDE